MSDDIEQFKAVLGVLNRLGILQDVVIIGGWAKLLYKEGQVIESPQYSTLRTSDIDILLSRPPQLKTRGNLASELAGIGFRPSGNEDGSTFFESKDFDIEFLIPERGKGDDSAVKIEELGIRVSSLRLVDDLLYDTISIKYAEYSITVPNPIAYCFHKLLISERRNIPTKKANDLETALEIGRSLVVSLQWAPLVDIKYQELPPKQKKTVLRLGKAQGNPIVDLIKKI